MRLLVCGGRDYANSEAVGYLLSKLQPGSIAHGNARGADSLADDWAVRNGVDVWRYPADWSTGRQAGPLRNQRMLEDFKPDVVIAFPGGRGTEDMVRRALAARVLTLRVSDKASESP